MLTRFAVSVFSIACLFSFSALARPVAVKSDTIPYKDAVRQSGQASQSSPSTSTPNWLRFDASVGIGVSAPAARLQVAGGDIYVQDIGAGIILRSPNGGCWRLSVDDSGAIIRTAVSCPGATGATEAKMLFLQPDVNTAQDGVVNSFYPNNVAAGLSLTWSSWTTDGLPTRMRTYLRFDGLPIVPTTARIDSAFLSLTYFDLPAYSAVSVGDNDTFVQRVTAPWQQSTLTWNNMPSVTTANQLLVPAALSGTTPYARLNVTKLVANMVANPGGSFGFSLRMQDETNAPPYRSFQFCSSESQLPARRPSLTVYYTQPR